jgi:hypothetical protein
MNDQPSNRGSRRDDETAPGHVRRYCDIHCDEVEHIAGELTLIAIALRQGISVVDRDEQWCLALKTIRLAHRLAVGSLRAARVDTDHASPGPLDPRPLEERLFELAAQHDAEPWKEDSAS